MGVFLIINARNNVFPHLPLEGLGIHAVILALLYPKSFFVRNPKLVGSWDFMFYNYSTLDGGAGEWAWSFFF